METRTLDFKDNNIQEISLDELKSTVKEEDYNKKPLMGMYHFDFIQRVADAVEAAKLKFEIEPIYAAQNKDKSRPGVSVIEMYRDQFGEGSVKSFLMRRIFSRIIISTLEDDQTNTAVAISYNQMGFQLAFGPNVKICKNQMILGAERFMSTYSHDNKMPNPERMIEVLSEWLNNFKEIRKKELETILAFQGTIVPHHEMLEIIGDMTSKRIRKDNAKDFPGEPSYPLSQSQIGAFTKAYMLEKQKDFEKLFSVWDVYNFATNLYKPGSTDFPLLLSSNANMSQYLMNRYQLS